MSWWCEHRPDLTPTPSSLFASLLHMQTVRRHAVASDPRRRRPRARLRVFQLEALGDASDLCTAICRDGIALIELPPAAAAAEKFARCRAVMAQFFARSGADKSRSAATEGPGCSVGYMLKDGGGEMFEARCTHDPRWPWPDDTVRSAVLDARGLLHRTARTCMHAIAPHLGLDPDSLEALLDQPGQPLQTSSNTAMRVWRYVPSGTGAEMHCDNTLLTLAPVASHAALTVRLFSDRSAVMPEDHMAPGAVLVR